MNFICKKEEICEAINNVSKAASVKSTIAALEGIKISLKDGLLEFTGYDLEIGIKTKIGVKSADSGECVLNSRLFSEIVRRMPSEEISVEIDENLNVKLCGNVTEYNVSAIPSDEYPDLPDFDREKSIVISQSVLKNMINQTNYAVSQKDDKPILTGELFHIENGCFNMVAIDGFRLAVRNEPLQADEAYRFVVPSRALLEVSRLLKDDENAKCTIHTNKKHIIFEISGYLVFSRLLEGEFHNYKASIPEGCKTEVIVKTRDMIECLERCSLLINEKNKAPVRCKFENGEISISCKTAIGQIQDEIYADMNGDMVEIGFNNKFILDSLKASESDKLRIQMNGASRPIKLLPLQGESFTFLLMPVQLKR